LPLIKIQNIFSNDMIKIEYPPYQPRIKQLSGKEYIFDEVRKLWMLLTPEEWVRQNFLQYLIKSKGYPPTLVAVEKEIKLAELVKRFDILVYNKDMVPWLMVECKEMKEVLNEKVLRQALGYNVSLKVQYIIITNGTYCYGFMLQNNEFVEINSLPEFPAF
jgi:Uncharacterized conserved protein